MSSLPRRPWARDDVPLVWRADDCVEIGWPPRQARVPGVDRAHVAWLLGLRGDRDLTQAWRDGRASGLRVATMRRLAGVAAMCGLLDDAATLPATLREAPLAVRDGLAGEIAAVRHVHGAASQDVIDHRRRAEVIVHGEGTLAESVALALTSAGIGSVLRTAPLRSTSRRHRQAAARQACHVLCASVHPDAAADTDAMAMDVPHLAVAAAGPQAVIGPLVLPGATSCLRCRDLHLADADPSWSRVAVQWAMHRAVPVASGLAQLAGTWAALQVIALVDAGHAIPELPTVDGAVVITLPRAAPELVPRPAHPLCGCRWPRTGHGIGA